jgi:hypothetical protein
MHRTSALAASCLLRRTWALRLVDSTPVDAFVPIHGGAALSAGGRHDDAEAIRRDDAPMTSTDRGPTERVFGQTRRNPQAQLPPLRWVVADDVLIT